MARKIAKEMVRIARRRQEEAELFIFRVELGVVGGRVACVVEGCLMRVQKKNYCFKKISLGDEWDNHVAPAVPHHRRHKRRPVSKFQAPTARRSPFTNTRSQSRAIGN